MTGVNAVTTPTDVSTCACSRSVLAVMSSMQLMRRVRTDRRSHAEFCISTWAITGSKAFSCSWPASEAMAIVTSDPATMKAT